jgi:diguanylate cyclase (GGDEF)-like protein
MSISSDALDDLLSSLPSAGAPPAAAAKTPKPKADPLSLIREKNPEFAKTAEDFMGFAKRGGVNDAYIKSGYRTAERQNYLHTHGYPTKGNDGYTKISPHQEARAIDWSTKDPANRQKLHGLIASYARKHKLYVPSDEPWHMAGHSNKLAQGDNDDLDALMRTVPVAQNVPAAARQDATPPALSTSGLPGSQPAAPAQSPQEAAPASLSPMGDSQPSAAAAPGVIAPPKIVMPTETTGEAEKKVAEETWVHPPQGVSGFTGNVGRIVDRGPHAETAYREFLQRNVPHLKGKAASSDELFKDESLATVFTKIQDFIQANPKAGPREQARSLALMGVDFLRDPGTKGKQLPRVLHAALLQSKLKPEEMQALPRNLQQQIQQHRQQEAAAREQRSKRQAAISTAKKQWILEAQETAKNADPELAKKILDEAQNATESQVIKYAKNRRFLDERVLGEETMQRFGREAEGMRREISDAHRLALAASSPGRVVDKPLDQQIKELSYGSVLETSEARRSRLEQLGQLESAKEIAEMSPARRLLHIATGETGPTVLGGLTDVAANVLHFADTLGGNIQGNSYVTEGIDALKDFAAYQRGRGNVPARGGLETGVKAGASMIGAAEKYGIMSPGRVPLWAVMGGEAALEYQDKGLKKQTVETAKGIVLGLALQHGPAAAQKALGKMPGIIGRFATRLPETTRALTAGAGFGSVAAAEKAREGGSTAEVIGTGLGAGAGATALSFGKGPREEVARKVIASDRAPETLREFVGKATGQRPVVLQSEAPEGAPARFASVYVHPKTGEYVPREISAEEASKLLSKDRPARIVPVQQFEQVFPGNKPETKPATEAIKPKELTASSETETKKDAGTVRSDQGLVSEAAPGSERQGSEGPRGTDIHREREAGKPVEPSEITTQRQEEKPIQGEGQVERRTSPERRRTADRLVRERRGRRSAERAAETDVLTGLGNRSALDKALPTAEVDPDTSVVIFDANELGKVNKLVEHGQQAGDAVIKNSANAISQAAQEFNVPARVFRRGGDEFVGLFPKDKAEAIKARAEEIMGEQVFEGTHGQTGEKTTARVSLTGSAGENFKVADEALQGLKAARKSRPEQSAGVESQPEKIGEQTPSTTEERVPALREPRSPTHPVVTGKETSIAVPDSDRAYKARYVVREAEDVVSSRNPHNFQPNPDYWFENDRRYDQEQQYQVQVMDRARPGKFDPMRIANNSPTADLGPPIIDAHGNVLGGNSRAMILHRVYQANDRSMERQYRAELMSQAPLYGLDPAQIGAMRRPILVREVSDEHLQSEEVQKAITELNRPSTTPLTQEERASAAVRGMSDSAAEYVSHAIESEGEDATLSSVMDAKGADIINKLIDEGVLQPGERNTLLKDGKPTAEAKQRVEKILTTGLYRDLKQMEDTAPGIRRNVERLVVPLRRVNGSEWDIVDKVRNAVDALNESKATGQSLDKIAQQTSLTREPYAEDAIAMAKVLQLGPRKTAEKFKAYAGDYAMEQSGGGLFGVVSQPQSFEKHFGVAPSAKGVPDGGKEKALQGEAIQTAAGTERAPADEGKGAEETEGSSIRQSGEGAESVRRDVDERAAGESEKAKGVTLQASVLPGAKAFVEKDLIPTVVQAGSDLRTILRGLTRVLAPRHGVARDTVDAVMRMKGERDKADFLLEAGLKDIKKYFDGLPQEEQVAFIDRMKRGEPQPNEYLQRTANFMRKVDQENWEKARATGIPINWLENHFRVLWKEIPGADPAKGHKGFRGVFRRPFRGSRGMTKAHTLVDMSEGIAKGGVPVTYNPARMFELAQIDLTKLITAQTLWDWGKKNKLVKWVREGKPGPEGFSQVKDSIARRYFRSPIGLVKLGDFYVEDGYARLLNNYLSKDYLRERGTAATPQQATVAAIGRSLLWYKNMSTAVELGLSAFHATFESGEGVSSQIGRALRRTYNLGILEADPKQIAKGVRELITSPIAPAVAAREGGSAIKYLTNKEEFLKTTRGHSFIEQFPDADALIDDLFTGGGRLAIHEDYLLNWRKNFREAISQGNYIGAFPRGVMAANEYIMHPLFQTYIPRLKIGVFLREHSLAIAENQKQLQSGKTTRAEIARKTWDFVEDRFGEMNFDNLFWDRTLKTAMQIMFRSVTWKLGNLRGALLAPVEQAREVHSAFKEKRLPRLTPKMAWLTGMSLLTATMGFVIMKAFTGKDPDSLYDFIYPQVDSTDDKQRVSLPTYARDEVALARDPKHYLLSSLSSEMSRTFEVWANKDFYGEEVYSEDDPVYQKAWDITKHYFPMPFSVTSYLKFRSQGEPSATQLTGFIGFPKAPAFVSMTPMDEVANEYYRSQEKVHGRPKDAAEKARVKRSLAEQMRHGKDPGAELDEALRSGLLQPSDFKDVKSRAALTPRQLSFRGLPLSVALDAYEKATLKQRDEVRILLTSKLDNAKPESLTAEIRKQIEDLGFVIPEKLGPRHSQSEQRTERAKERREKKSLRWLPPTERPAAGQQIRAQAAVRRRYMVQPR